MIDPNKRGKPVNFTMDHEAHEALRSMLGKTKRYGSFLSSLVLQEHARREERERIAREKAARA